MSKEKIKQQDVNNAAWKACDRAGDPSKPFLIISQSVK